MPATTLSAALAPAVPVFTNTKRLALAGFLAGYTGYSGLTLHRRFIVPGQGAGPAIAQVNDCGGPTARLPTRTISPGPSCSAGWTSCRCRASAPPPTWTAERLASPPAPQLDLRARRAQTSTRRALKPPGLGRAVFPELPVAALCATLALQGGNRDRARWPSRIPSARWLRTFGSFRAGRAVATMMV
jgi:hypothetical protein